MRRMVVLNQRILAHVRQVAARFLRPAHVLDQFHEAHPKVLSAQRVEKEVDGEVRVEQVEREHLDDGLRGILLVRCGVFGEEEVVDLDQMHRRVQQKKRRRDNQEHLGDPPVILEPTQAVFQEILKDVGRRLNVVAFEEAIVLARFEDDQRVQRDNGEERNDEGEKEIDDVHLTRELQPLAQCHATRFVRGRARSFGFGQFDARRPQR